MPNDTIDRLPPDYLTPAQADAQQALEDAKKPGFFQAIGDSVNAGWVTSSVARQMVMGFQDHEPDPSFQLTEELIKKYGEGIPPAMWDFADATSETHMIQIREQLLDVASSRENLARLGWKGVTLDIATNFLDPVQLGIGALSGGIGLATKGERLASFVRSGLAAGLTNAGIEAYVATQDATRDETDVLLAGLAGFALGGAAGAWDARLPKTAKAIQNAIMREELEAAGATVTDAGKQVLKPVATPLTNQTVDHAVAQQADGLVSGVPTKTVAAEPTTPQGVGVGAASPAEITARAELDQLRPSAELAQSKNAQSPPPISHDDLRQGMTVRLYRGEGGGIMGESVAGGDWWTTDFNKAKQYGSVTSVDISSDILARISAQGSASKYDFVVQGGLEKIIKSGGRLIPENLAQSVGAESLKQSVGAATPAEIARSVELDHLMAREAAQLKPGDFNPELPSSDASSGIGVRGAASSYGRMDMVGMLGNSDVPEVSQAARLLAQDSMGSTKGHVPIGESASEATRRAFQVRYADFGRATTSAFNSFSERRGISRWQWIKRSRAFDGFLEEVTNAVRGTGAGPTDPDVARVADKMRSIYKEARDYYNRHAEDAIDDAGENYVNRVFSLRNINRLMKDRDLYGDNGEYVVKLIAKGLMNKNYGKLTQEQAEKIAGGYWKRVLDIDNGNEFLKERMFSQEKIEELRSALRDNGVPEGQIDDLLYDVSPKQDGGGITRALKRLDIDESVELMTPSGKVLRFTDLLENNAQVLMAKYLRQTIGEAHLTKVRNLFRNNAEDAINTRQQFLARIRAAGGSESEISRLDTLYKSVAGIPLNKSDGLWADSLRAIRGYNEVRLGGQFGAAQIPEIGPLVSNAGWTATLKQMPVLTEIFSRAKTGELSNPLLREIEAFWGTATGSLNRDFFNRLDDTADFGEQLAGRIGGLINVGKKAVHYGSGMHAMDVGMRRMAMAAGIQKWADFAASGKMPSLKRLASLNLIGPHDDPTKIAREILEQFKHATTEKGILGSRVTRLNMHLWDQNVAAKFTSALDRWSARVIQTNDIGNLSQWMTTDGGRLVAQFRNFGFVSWQKGFLYNLRMNDVEGYMGWLYASVLGALTYTAQTYVNTIGRQDADSLRRENLSLSKIVFAGFQRAGFSSMMTLGIDMAAKTQGAQSPFSFARTSGLERDPLMGNPTFDFWNNATQAFTFLRAMADGDYEYSQKDWRINKRLIPFQNYYGVRNVLDAIGDRLPRTSYWNDKR